MSFSPQVGDRLNIDGVIYQVAEHPAAPGMPYGQEGRQATVYQLAATSEEKRALKVFKPRYRSPGLVKLTDRVAPFAALPGLEVCKRAVLTPQQHAPLLRAHSDLTYAVLMPWIEGPTWMEVLLEKQELALEDSLTLARALADVLSSMEQSSLAHCDLSAPNIMLPALAESAARNPQSPVALVDVESIYGPGLERPQEILSGSQGYAHKTAAEGIWRADADRFAGAVLIAEMLGWCDEQVRKAAWGENYFDTHEMQQDCERYRLLTKVLRERWGNGVADLFEQAWRSETLADCATFGEWLVTLPENVPAIVSPSTIDTPTDAHKVLMELGHRLEQQGNLAAAVEVYRQALVLAPTGSSLAEELALIVQSLEKAARAAVPETQRLPAKKVEARNVASVKSIALPKIVWWTVTMLVGWAAILGFGIYPRLRIPNLIGWTVVGALVGFFQWRLTRDIAPVRPWWIWVAAVG